MKVQFATLEALLALAMALSAASAAGSIIAGSGHALYAAREAASRSAAAYDFIMQMTENSSAASCLASAEYNGSGCMGSYARYYAEIYGIKRIGIIGNNATGYNYSDVYCSEGPSGQFCVGVS